MPVRWRWGRSYFAPVHNDKRSFLITVEEFLSLKTKHLDSPEGVRVARVGRFVGGSFYVAISYPLVQFEVHFLCQIFYSIPQSETRILIIHRFLIPGSFL